MTVCFKCGAEPPAVCSREGAAKSYCTSCFLQFCTRHMRESLFRHCGVPCEMPLVVAVSGGHNSTALLHQLGLLRLQNRMRDVRGQIAFHLLPLHLREEELVVPPTTCNKKEEKERVVTGERETAFCAVVQHMQEQFERLETMLRVECTRWTFADLSLFTEDELCVMRYSDFLSPNEMQEWRRILHHSRLSLSDRELLYLRLRQRVLALAAAACTQQWNRVQKRENTWHYILTGENALRCSVVTLREVISGGGVNVIHHGGYRGYINHCLFLRPLRSMLPRELVLYCHVQHIWAGYTPTLSTYTSLRSLLRVIEHFLHKMMTSYHTSIFNIIHTVTKLESETVPELLCVDMVQKERSSSSSSSVATNTNTKQITPGKAAQHHYKQLQNTTPPSHSWCVKEEGVTEMYNGPLPPLLCLFCGCVIPSSHEHAVLLPQRAGRRFLCDACAGFLETLPGETHTTTTTSSTHNMNDSGLVAAAQPPAESHVLHHSVLDVFASLAVCMESVVRGGNAVVSRDISLEETRSVRRRVSREQIKEFLLEDEEEKEEV